MVDTKNQSRPSVQQRTCNILSTSKHRVLLWQSGKTSFSEEIETLKAPEMRMGTDKFKSARAASPSPSTKQRFTFENDHGFSGGIINAEINRPLAPSTNQV